MPPVEYKSLTSTNHSYSKGNASLEYKLNAGDLQGIVDFRDCLESALLDTNKHLAELVAAESNPVVKKGKKNTGVAA